MSPDTHVLCDIHQHTKLHSFDLQPVFPELTSYSCLYVLLACVRACMAGVSKTYPDCCAECARTPGCAAFTLWTGGPQCYLKYNASGSRPLAGHVSGTVPNPLPPPPDTKQFQNETDCLMRSFFVEYAAAVNPIAAQPQHVAEMIAALSGDPMMGDGCVVKPDFSAEQTSTGTGTGIGRAGSW